MSDNKLDNNDIAHQDVDSNQADNKASNKPNASNKASKFQPASKPKYVQYCDDVVEESVAADNTPPNVEIAKRKDHTWWITLCVVVAITLLILFAFSKVQNCETVQEIFMALSNAFVSSGAIVISFALLVVLANYGAFTMLTFGIKHALHVFFPRPKIKHQSYYDYIEAHKAKPKMKVKWLFIIGSVPLVVGIVFNILYYYV